MKTAHPVLQSHPGIYLVGFMGSGKTTVGRLLAKTIGWRFIDLDDDIEAASGTSIGDLFDIHGEAHFRLIETAALQKRIGEVRNGEALVLSLGGGAFAQPRNREILNGAGLSVWLDAPLELAQRRVAGFSHRPLARDHAGFRTLFQTRRDDYALAGERVAIGSDDPRPAVEAIVVMGCFT